MPALDHAFLVLAKTEGPLAERIGLVGLVGLVGC